MCMDLLNRQRDGTRITAKMVLACAGFLNFVAGVIRQARPFLRSLFQVVASAQVFQAWQRGKRRLDPEVTLSQEAIQDLTWWILAFHTPLHRALHVAGGRVFVWHQRHPNLQALQDLVWNEGLVVIVHTDASGEDGWGVACGSVWRQGRWSESEMAKSINLKELEAFRRALTELSQLLANKLVLLKSDNTCAAHYVNAGTGPIGELADLAKSIRLQEVTIGAETVAIHIPGEVNVTAAGLSRMLILEKARDPWPDRSLRRRLFRQIEAAVGQFDVDAMVADDGHNAHCESWYSPSR